MACHDWLDLIKHVNRVFLVIQHCSVRFKRLAEYFTLRNIIKMARPSPVQYNMSYRVSFETVIRGHHVYKLSWKLKINQVIHYKEDERAEAKEYNINTICMYVTHTTRCWKYSCWPCNDQTIAFVDLLQQATFLQANADNLLTAKLQVEKKGGWSFHTSKVYSL